MSALDIILMFGIYPVSIFTGIIGVIIGAIISIVRRKDYIRYPIALGLWGLLVPDLDVTLMYNYPIVILIVIALFPTLFDTQAKFDYKKCITTYLVRFPFYYLLFFFMVNLYMHLSNSRISTEFLDNKTMLLLKLLGGSVFGGILVVIARVIQKLKSSVKPNYLLMFLMSLFYGMFFIESLFVAIVIIPLRFIVWLIRSDMKMWSSALLIKHIPYSAIVVAVLILDGKISKAVFH